jgi:YD repeat-containing protein
MSTTILLKKGCGMKQILTIFFLSIAAAVAQSDCAVVITNSGPGTYEHGVNVAYLVAIIQNGGGQPNFPKFDPTTLAGYTVEIGDNPVYAGDYVPRSGSGGYFYGWYNTNSPNPYQGNQVAVFNDKLDVLWSGFIAAGTFKVVDVYGPEEKKKCQDDSGCCGMPVWSVSEPSANLHLRDEPLGYQPVQGSRISFGLNFKQRDSHTGLGPNLFSVGKRWNFSWFSYVTGLSSFDTANAYLAYFQNGGQGTYALPDKIDYLTNTKLTGDTTSGFTISYPDGSQDFYGLPVTNIDGHFYEALLTQHSNPQSQKTILNYYAYTPRQSDLPYSVRLQSVVDGDGRTNFIYYATNNAFSTNLISSVVDPFGRMSFLSYDAVGNLTNIIDVAGISSSISYDLNDQITSLTTPYGTTGFSITDDVGLTNNPAPYRSVLITQPDGGNQLYLFAKGAIGGLTNSYAAGQVPSTTPFSNTFENSALAQRNSFYWGPRQYAALSTTNSASFSNADFLKARMKHWLIGNEGAVGDTVSMQRDPSPETGGALEGQKSWYDYAGKSGNAYEGTQANPLFVAQVLPDGTTRFTRSLCNTYGAVTNQVSTYSVTAGGTALLRTNIFVYDSTGIDQLAQTNALGILVSSNVYNAFNAVTTNYNALGEKTVYTYDSGNRFISVTAPTGLITTNIYGSDGFLAQQIVIGFSTNSYVYTNGLVASQTDARGLTLINTYDGLQRLRRLDYPDSTFITNSYNALDLVQMVDRMGFGNSYSYDNMRRKVFETNALGRYTSYNYCNCGSLTSIQDAAGNQTKFFYDNQGRMTNAVYADGYGVTNTLNLIGQMIATTDSAGTSGTNWFNNQGLTVAVSNAFGPVQTTVYDLLDRATNSVDANGVSVNTTYDILNRARTRSYPDGGLEGFGYTLNVSGMTGYTNQLNQTNFYAYDAASRKIAETNANGEITQFSYDGAGDLLTLTDGKNQTTTWIYDQFGRQTNKVDAANNLLFVYKYDMDNRLTNRWSLGRTNTAYAYDKTGNLTGVTYQAIPLHVNGVTTPCFCSFWFLPAGLFSSKNCM